MAWRNPWLYLLIMISIATPASIYFWRQDKLNKANQNATYKSVDGLTARKYFQQGVGPTPGPKKTMPGQTDSAESDD